MSYQTRNITRITTNGGARELSGVIFVGENNEWVADHQGLKLKLNPGHPDKCQVFDPKTGESWPFKSVHMAKVFSQRRRHGRTLEEHERVESVLVAWAMSRMGKKEFAESLGVSPRTIEAWMSGVRVVPNSVMEKIGKATEH